MLAVKLSVAACMPAEVGLPRNHTAAPLNAGLAVSIAIHEDLAPLAVMTRPWAVSLSALMTSMLTRALTFTTTTGLTLHPEGYSAATLGHLPGTARAWRR